MSIFKSSRFIKSVDKIENIPEKHLNEVLFVGKSNVGKSSLINSLTNNKKLAYTSSRPGLTKFLNYYLINNEFYFVDAPGYGYSSSGGKDYLHYGKLLEDYFSENENLKLILFLLDSRHAPTQDDLTFYQFLNEYNYNYVLVMTKCDKLNMSMRSKIRKNLESVFGDISDEEIILTSSIEPKTIENLSLLITTYIGGINQ